MDAAARCREYGDHEDGPVDRQSGSRRAGAGFAAPRRRCEMAGRRRSDSHGNACRHLASSRHATGRPDDAGVAAAGRVRRIQQISYETAIPIVEPPSQRSAPEIIAVSASVTVPAAPADAEQEESSETLFAFDRPFRTVYSGGGSTGGIVQTSASVAVPPLAGRRNTDGPRLGRARGR